VAEAEGAGRVEALAWGLVGAMVGTAVVLFAYDRLVVQPREAARAQQVALDVAAGRTEVQRIAAGLDASVDRSLDRARDGLDALAGDQDRARLANEALQRGAMVRVALSEAYMSNGAWPASAAEAGLPAFDAQAPGAVESIDVGPGGVVAIALRTPFAGSRFVLTPRVGTDGTVQWRCASEGDAALRRYVPACAP
jgi:hypothetical protein